MKRIMLAIVIVFLSTSILNAKTLSGNIKGIGCASDTQKGFQLAKSLAEVSSKSGIISKIFVMGDSLLNVTFNRTGDRAYQSDPNGARFLLRSWVKLMRDYYGTPAISVTLHESDGTTIGEGSISIFSGKIKAEIY